MVVARLIVFKLLLIALGFWVFAGYTSAQTVRREKIWAAGLQTPNAAHFKNLRQTLLKHGAQIKHEGGSFSSRFYSAAKVPQQTRIFFEGSPQDFTALVNALLPEPFEWARWSCEELPAGTVRGSITLKNCAL